MYNELIETIDSANAFDIEDILCAAIERKRQLFPDWDILYLAVQKNNESERKLTLDCILQWYFK